MIEKVTAPTKSAGGVLLPESAVPKVGRVTAAAETLTGVIMQGAVLYLLAGLSAVKFPALYANRYDIG